MPTNELTLEAKAAIQSYILKFVLPSGAALAVISGLFGYVLSGIARIDASAEATKSALYAAQSAAEAKANASAASLQASKASDQANVSLGRANFVALKSEETMNSLFASRDQINKSIAGQYDELAKALFETRGFREIIAEIPQQELLDIKGQIKKIEDSIYGVLDPAMPAVGNVCPAGTYAVALNTVGAPGGRAGFVESASIQCRTVRFEKPQ